MKKLFTLNTKILIILLLPFLLTACTTLFGDKNSNKDADTTKTENLAIQEITEKKK